MKDSLYYLFTFIIKHFFIRGKISAGEIVYKYLEPKNKIKTIKVGEIPVELDISQPELRYIYYNIYENEEISFIEKHLNKGDTVIDVGANIGYLSAVMCKSVGTEGKVFAFEPNPATYKHLEKTANASKGIIRPFQKAISDSSNQIIPFFINSSHHMWSSMMPDTSGEVSEVLNVPTLSLIDFIENEKLVRVDFIKIDVEGGESSVLSGLYPALEDNFRPTILCEVMPSMEALFEKTLDIIEKMVDVFNYKIFFIVNNELSEISITSLKSISSTKNIVLMISSAKASSRI